MVKCEFSSVWNGGDEVVTTDCMYDPKTGYVEPEISTEEPPIGVLDREYITLDNDEEKEVCPDCHEYVLKTVVGDRSDLSYGEMEECPNEDCPSN